MGVAYYISLDREDVDFDPMIDGKRVAKAGDLLNRIAKENYLPEVMHFFGMDGTDIESLLGESDIPDAGGWHDSGKGSEYFARLAELVSRRADASKHKALVEELQEFSQVLAKAKAAGAQWRLAMDF